MTAIGVLSVLAFLGGIFVTLGCQALYKWIRANFIIARIQR